MSQQRSITTPRARQLALEINGIALLGEVQPSLAYQVALAALDGAERATLAELAAMVPVTTTGGLFDDVGEVLTAIGCAITRVPDGTDPFSRGTRVVAVGCPHRSLRLDELRLHDFLAAGGVLITSDKAALVPGLRELLPTLKPRAPRRARLALAGGGEEGGLLPAVNLDAGHAPLDAERLHASAEVLAYDGLTGEPLVVALPVANGRVIHAVPHWRQPTDAALTGLELRPLATVANYREFVPSGGEELTLGAFWSALGMLRSLVAGLAHAVGAGRELPDHADPLGRLP